MFVHVFYEKKALRQTVESGNEIRTVSPGKRKDVAPVGGAVARNAETGCTIHLLIRLSKNARERLFL